MARARKPELTPEDIAADVALLMKHGFTQADAEAMTPDDRAELVASLPDDAPEGEAAADESAPTSAPDAEVAPEPAPAPEAPTPEAAAVEHSEPEAVIEADSQEEAAEIEGEPLDGVVLNMVAEPERAPFNEGIQHQLELKWAEFTAFAKTVEHRVEGELGDIVGWIKAHA